MEIPVLRKTAGRVIKDKIRKISVTPLGKVLDGGPYKP